MTGRKSERILVASLLALSACRAPAPARRVIVLGVDGMDPGFVESHWSALPNFARLKRRGGFSRLRTTTPPQSPVAWSTFITGLDPGEHGIYDFVHRDPSTLQPFSSMSKTEEGRFYLPLGPYILPLSRSRVVSLRKGQAFWQTLAEHGVPVTIVRMPTNYPPIKTGEALSGMGTPDLRGTLGTFSLYTDAPDEMARSVPGGRMLKAEVINGRANLEIEGPPNSLRKDQRFSTVSLAVDVDPDQPLARLSLDGVLAIVRQGEWSDWLAADFTLVPHLVSVRGAFRVYAKQLHPGFALYVSPVNIDPVSPGLPISAPSGWSKTIASEMGRYYTQGTPEDTAALRQGAFTLPEFLSQSHLVLEEECKLLSYSLRHFSQGLLFFYFSSIDQNSHMLWKKHDAELLEIYREVDASLGEVMRQQPGAELIVMSDHGFTTFDRAVNLNTWLYERGFLALTGPPGQDAGLSAIDWPNTDAYALGLNGLYVNLAGREKYGRVQPGERRRALIENIRQQLLAFRDPANGQAVVEAVFETKPSPGNRNVAPDLIVGYSRGYRASWQTGIGETPKTVVDDNTDAWIGDHCVNPADVPGVLFTSGHLRTSNPSLKDVTVLVLDLFGVQPIY